MRDVAESPLLDYGGLNPILRFLEGRSDAACRVVIKRMREERFNRALPVLVVVHFLRGGLRGVLLPLAGACGRQGFWVRARARDSRNAVCGYMRKEGVERHRQKPPRTSPGASFLSPLSLATQRKGAQGRTALREWRGIPCVLRCAPCKA